MNCKRVVVLVVMFLSLVFVGACTTDVDYTMGEEFVPANQHMELKRRVYRLGEVIDGDNTAKCGLVETRLYHTDTIVSSNLGSGYFGREADDTYGARTAGFMSQMIFSMSLDEERGWGYRPIFDSMTLSLYVTDFHGDTTKTHRFEVYEIISNDYFELPKDKDSTFYMNFDPSPYISKEPIFTFDYPNQQKGIYVGDMENPTNVDVRLKETAATSEYLSRLMLTTEMEQDGGFALDKDSIYVEGNEQKFIDRIKGIYIAPADDMEGAMFVTDLDNTALLLYSRSRYEEDPTIIRDTTYMVYNLYLDPRTYDIDKGNVSINTISHDYAGSKAASEGVLSTCYVDGMGGVVTEVMFTDEFIQSLADIVHEAGEDATVSINQAMLSVYLEGASYDYQNLTALTDYMNTVMTRLGLYTDYRNLIAVADYAYTAENSSTKLAYDGYLNRSLGCYKMDISTYIQVLMLAAAKNCDENGNVKLDMFSQDYEPTNESLVNLRRVYIAPEAYSLFGLKRQALYGGYDPMIDSAAPIKLELTYTVVN